MVLLVLLGGGYSNLVILILGTAVVTFGCWIFFEITKRHWITRAMYGIKELPIKNEIKTESKPAIEEK